MDLTTVTTPLERPINTFSGRAVEVLRELILSGRLKSGERINEVELSTALGISRGPLREAIQHLRSEGLLVTISHRGAFVRAFSQRELSDLYEVRIALETHAVKLATRSASTQAIAELGEMLQDTEQSMAVDNNYPRDRDFHDRIVQLADCQAISDAVLDVHRKIQLARSRSGYDSTRAPQALSDHREVLKHMARGDGETAAGVLAGHLRSALENALAVLRADDIPEPTEDYSASAKRGSKVTRVAKS
jgi:DNA-binding GntR family transcriptional regulator